MMQTAPELDPTSTVNALMAQDPRTVAVFDRFGLDTCCGGDSPLDEAARREGVELEALLAALRAAMAAP